MARVRLPFPPWRRAARPGRAGRVPGRRSPPLPRAAHSAAAGPAARRHPAGRQQGVVRQRHRPGPGGRHAPAGIRGVRQILRFPQNERRRVTWDLPADWQREPNVVRGDEKMMRTPPRYATFRAGPQGLEVKVLPLGREAEQLKPNVDRWRGQIGLPPITDAELSKVCRPIIVNGVNGTFVDMTGPGANAEAADGGTGAAPPPASDETLTYDTPPGWQVMPARRNAVCGFQGQRGRQVGRRHHHPAGRRRPAVCSPTSTAGGTRSACRRRPTPTSARRRRCSIRRRGR